MSSRHLPKWKGNATNSVIPTNSRPFSNKDPNIGNIARVPFKPNPIKHWRKQLKPYYSTPSSKQVSINMIDAPGSVNYISSQTIDCSNNYALLKENITLLNSCNGIKITDENDNNKTTCRGGSNHIRRSANTNVQKSYYKNHAKYLQAKCKTYEQNMHLGEKTADYTYKSSKCTQLNETCNKSVIHKPSNRPFSTQGAVPSSANILRKRNNALTNNGSSLKTAYGRAPVMKRGYYAGETGYDIYYVKGSLTDSTNNQASLKCCKKV